MNEFDAINKILQEKKPRPIKDSFYWKKYLIQSKPKPTNMIPLARIDRLIFSELYEELRESTRNTDG